MVALTAGLFAVIQSAQAAAGLVVSIDDTDNIVTAGRSNDVRLHVTGDDGGAAYDVAFVIASNGVVYNELDSPVLAITPRSANTDPHVPMKVGDIIYPPTAEGEYTITARVTRAASGTLGDQSYVPAATLDDTLVIRVGEAGDAIGSAELSLGKVGHSTAKNAKSDSATTAAYGSTKPESHGNCSDTDATSVVAPNSLCVAVTLSVKNSLGDPANSDDISGIHIFAPLADIYILGNDTEGTRTTPNGASTDDGTISLTEAAADQDGVGSTIKFYVAKEAPGTTDVSAIVLGTGNATAANLTLTFTGAAAHITLGDPSSPLSTNGTKYVKARGAVDLNDDDDTEDEGEAAIVEVKSMGVANIEVNATDKAGNPAPLTLNESVVVEVTNADGNIVDTFEANQREKPNSLTLIVEMVGVDAEPGTYTVTMTLGDDLDEQTAEIVVAGKVANVEAEVSQDTVAVGDIITVTATVTDADGNLQPDAGTVMFQAVGSLKLTGLGAAGTSGGHAEGKLDDGVATGRFVVVDGSGTSTIIASVGDIDAVTSVSTEAAEAMAQEEASVACLSNLAGFATWACGVESSASEIFGLVSGRGATALHLWNGSAWVRYSVVDGTMVPGSSDFMVAENDILYISN